ncbi:MAG: glycoside hydrolase family 20 zincin-like fold domain-containing protein, partial [Candidatus Hydrogenedentes bacterium]|nr:glycoside hydrolase family 20 zincin-like fold domain-containing protein [Candidatus Hydrogenedentota bacterium]
MQNGIIRCFLLVLAGFSITTPLGALDLSEATIVPAPATGVVMRAATMLQEELAERSGVTLLIAEQAPAKGVVIRLGTRDVITGIKVPNKPEGYGIAVSGRVVKLAGYDERGALYAAGRLIRLAEYAPGTLTLDLKNPIATAPDVPVRAHQLGFRDTANTYDAWTIYMYEQYIRDLIFFGCNGIELITNLDPALKDGPVMTQTVRAMNVKLSALIHSYGIDVWLWSPVMADGDEDVTTPEGLAKGLEKRRGFLADYPAIDHLFVPGGDDGSTPAEHLMPFLEGLAPILEELHPNAKIWVSNQTFTLEENDYFFDYLATKKPDWLAGVVYGPWIKMGWEEMRERTPARYPIRRYPDINHTLRCQYPIPDWDPAFANTVGREPMMPMPKMQRHIYLRYRDVSDGFGTYSDGIHDDLNKHVWNVLGWESNADMDTALREYGKVWFGVGLAKDVARGMRLFEANWRGSILKNTSIPKTLALWEDIAARVPDYDTNWRAQMYLFRARFDANVQAEVQAQRRYEEQARAALAKASTDGVKKAVEKARAALAQADTPAAPELRTRIEALGPVLLESIGYQLSVEAPYLARNTERGAMLD